MPSDQHPSGYIISNADDLLELFDADYGVLVVGEGAKILGPNEHGQEILIVAEYLRLKRFTYVYPHYTSSCLAAGRRCFQHVTGIPRGNGRLLRSSTIIWIRSYCRFTVDTVVWRGTRLHRLPEEGSTRGSSMGWEAIRGRGRISCRVGTMEILQIVVRDDDWQV